MSPIVFTVTSASFTCSRRLSHFGLEILLQRNGVVVLGVVRAVDERDPTPAGGGHDWFPRLRVRVELAPVPFAKVVPFLRIVAEPLAQFCGRADSFQPCFNPQLRL